VKKPRIFLAALGALVLTALLASPMLAAKPGFGPPAGEPNLTQDYCVNALGGEWTTVKSIKTCVLPPENLTVSFLLSSVTGSYIVTQTQKGTIGNVGTSDTYNSDTDYSQFFSSCTLRYYQFGGGWVTREAVYAASIQGGNADGYPYLTNSTLRAVALLGCYVLWQGATD
jgi:hypothetical protein